MEGAGAVLAVNGLKVFLPAESRILLEGVTVDFAETALEAGLKFFAVRSEDYDLVFSKAIESDPRYRPLQNSRSLPKAWSACGKICKPVNGSVATARFWASRSWMPAIV